MRSSAPILSRHGRSFLPVPEAGGPFGGLHGGPVAAALALAMEDLVHGRHGLQPLALHVQLLRPTPLKAFEVDAGIVREGRRVLVLGAELRAADKVSATATAVFGRPQDIPGLAAPAAQAGAPEACLVVMVRPPEFRGVWFGDVCEFRRRSAGFMWVRMTRPLAHAPTPLAYIAALADWSTGTSKPDGFERPVVGAFPNADLTVHLARLPDLAAGEEWVGLDGTPRWMPNGLGITATVIHDRRGAIGQACQAVVLSPA
ncbi:MAG: thioesterase family protein [Pseudomonadota bacterium]